MIAWLEKHPVIRLILMGGGIAAVLLPVYVWARPFIERNASPLILILYGIIVFMVIEIVTVSRSVRGAPKGGTDKKDRIVKFGLFWIVDYEMKMISDPLCPQCQSPLHRFHKDTVQEGPHKGKERMWGVCTACDGRNSFCPTNSEDGAPMTVIEAKQLIKRELRL